MLVMGLDTSLQCCSVSILKDGEVIADQSLGMERGHAERLAPMAAAALIDAGIAIRDLDRVGVVVGPGGFTGVRVGLSFARGLAIGTGIDVVGITSLAALAGNETDATPDTLIAPVIDARRGQVYAGLYAGDGAVVIRPFVATPEQVVEKLKNETAARPVSLLGSGAAQIASAERNWRQSDAPTQISAVEVARQAAVAPKPDGSPAPLYLRAPDAKPPKPSRFEGISKK